MVVEFCEMRLIVSPEYLSEDRGGADVEFDFFRYGQLGTRRFNSLKLWMAIQFMGRQGYAKTVEHQISLTEYLARRPDESPYFSRVERLKRPSVVSVFFPKQQNKCPTWKSIVYNNGCSR